MSTQPIPSPPIPRRRVYAPMARTHAARAYMAHFAGYMRIAPHLAAAEAVAADALVRRNLDNYATEHALHGLAAACWEVWAQRGAGVRACRARRIEVRERLVWCGLDEVEAWELACGLEVGR